MAKRMNDGVELIKTLTGKGSGGSRPKPPKAVVRSARLEAPLSLPDHEKAKRCLTAKTVAFSSAAWALPINMRFVGRSQSCRMTHYQYVRPWQVIREEVARYET